MCEHCRISKVEFTEWEPEADETCEWVDDSEIDWDQEPIDQEAADQLPVCPEPPRFCATDTFVSEHFCDLHKENNPELEPEAQEFAEELGLGTSELLPIRQGDSKCDFVDASGRKCSNRATWAYVLTVDTLLCGGHAAQFKRELAEEKRKG